MLKKKPKIKQFVLRNRFSLQFCPQVLTIAIVRKLILELNKMLLHILKEEIK